MLGGIVSQKQSRKWTLPIIITIYFFCSKKNPQSPVKSFNGIWLVIVSVSYFDIDVHALQHRFQKIIINSDPWSIRIVWGAPYKLIQLPMMAVETVLADLSGRATAQTYLLNWSSIVKIYLFLLTDKDMGPTRSMHNTSLTFFAWSLYGSTSLRFICSLCKQPAHSVTKIDVSFLQPG